MRNAGAKTIGQDEASSLIYGMPHVAFERGGVMRQCSLVNVADAILDACEADADARQPARTGGTGWIMCWNLKRGVRDLTDERMVRS